MRFVLLLVIGSFCLANAPLAQNLIPNSSFEEGTNQPTAWALFAGPGQWESPGRKDERSVSVIGFGDCGANWRPAGLVPLQPQSLYILRFWGKGEKGFGGNGLFANWDGVGGRSFIPREEWLRYGYAAVIPSNITTAVFRLGQCSMQGKGYFDDVQWRRALPMHTRFNGRELGVGERVYSNRYFFQTRSTDFFNNYSRPLDTHTASFGGPSWAGHWVLDASRFITYRHRLDQAIFTNATIQMTFYHHTSGDLIVDTSADGMNWQEQLRFKPPVSGNITTSVGTNLSLAAFPAAEVYVRLRASGSMSIAEYRFQAETVEALPTAEGHTWFLEQDAPLVNVDLISMANTPTGHVFIASVTNTNILAGQFEARQVVSGPSGTWSNTVSFEIAGETNEVVSLLFPGMGPGENTLSLEVRTLEADEVLLRGSIHTIVPAIYDQSFGAMLPTAGPDSVWWCSSTHKVGRQRALPGITNETVRISAARNEYEPFQLVVRPDSTVSNATISITDFVGRNGAGGFISASNVTFCVTEYLPVRVPTDTLPSSSTALPSSVPGDYPDPLIPIAGSFVMEGGMNHPIWITVYVPPDAPAGEYEAQINLTTETVQTITVRLQVSDFSLSKVTHTKTAYHVVLDDSWHGITNQSQRQAVWDLYMQNFAQHRVSPIWPHFNSPAKWTVSGQTVTLDLTEFDTAISQALEEHRFNSFNLVQMPTVMGGQTRFTAGFKQLFASMMMPLANHLREKGWSHEAYMYWYDEPQPPTYPFVIEGMELIKANAPDVRRLLTPFSVDSVLYRHVDIWCLMVSLYDYYPYWAGSQLRLDRGDETWWYACIAPRTPRPNNFIDYPAVDHRARFWVGEAWGITGDLYWQTTHYRGTNGSPKNPYLETMTGNLGVLLGNGDGLLLYPPTKTPPPTPQISGPVNSLRWELTREALEDGEYFWLLKDVLSRRKPVLGPHHPAIVEGESAYAAAMSLSATLNSFHRNAEEYLGARARIAAAIEALEDGRPFVVAQPRSQAVQTGQTLALQVEALGWPLPVYQWQRFGTNLPGATGAKFMLPNFTPADAGSYSVIASNAMGMAQSRSARVAAFSDFPQFVSEPEPVIKHAGETAVFTACAVSSNSVAYQWFFEGQPITALASHQAALVITNITVAHTGNYFVIASNSSGVLTSVVVRLSVLSNSVAPVIVSVSPDLTRYAGQLATLQVEARSATPLSYRWYHEDTEIGGVDSPTLYVENLQPADAGTYTVVVSNAVGSALAPVQLTVLPAPTLEAAIIANANPMTLQIPPAAVLKDLLVSTNLTDWNFLKRIHPSQYPTVLTISNAPGTPARFYRLRLAD